MITVLEARGFELSGELRDRIRATADPALLKDWIRRGAVASALGEVFD